MRHKVKEKTKDDVAEDQCRHYWIIETANGPKSRGMCQYCGEARVFFNSISAFNEMRSKTNPLDLPEMLEVELDKDSKS